MVLTIVLLAVLLALNTITGLLLYKYVVNGQRVESIPIHLAACMGLVGAYFYTAAISLFLPINIYVQLAYVLLVGWFALVNRAMLSTVLQKWLTDIKQTPWPIFIIFLLIWLGLALKAAAPSTYYDEGLYYLQTIRWIEEYGIVKGLALVHGRLGFNSSWHLTQALFSGRGLGHILGINLNIYDINALLCLIMVFPLLGAAKKLWHGPATFNAWLWLGFGVYVLLVSVVFLSSPSADLAVALLTPYLFICLIDNPDDDKLKVLAILAVFMITIKLSAIWLMIIALYALVKSRFQYKLLIVLVLLVIPYMARNYIATGYLLYPVKITAVAEPEWQLPRLMVDKERLEAEAFAKFPKNMRLSDEERKKGVASPSLWMPLWWYQMMTYPEKLLIILFPITLFLIMIYIELDKTLKYVICTSLIIMFLFWLNFAPALRFGYGIMATPLVIILAHTLKHLHRKQIVIPILLICTGFFLYQIRDLRVIKQHILWPALAHTTKLASGYTGNIKIYWPNPDTTRTDPQVPVPADQCWDAPLPCTLDKNFNFEPIGTRIEEGFRPKVNPAH